MTLLNWILFTHFYLTEPSIKQNIFFDCQKYKIVHYLFYDLSQRCPTHSPLATCGEWPIICGKWLSFEIFQNCDVLNKIKILGTKLRLFGFNSHSHWDCHCHKRMTMYLFTISWLLTVSEQKTAWYYFSSIFKMCRMASFICHICGERKNTLGHHWSKYTGYYLSHGALCRHLKIEKKKERKILPSSHKNVILVLPYKFVFKHISNIS